MTINDRYSAGLQPSIGRTDHTAGIPPGETQRKASQSGSTQSDGVHLSTLARALDSALSTESTGRAARVEQLQAQVRAGSYEVDPMVLSRRLVDVALTGDA
jgi:flagellar biosynthesis anti-sigma factor FlgM